MSPSEEELKAQEGAKGKGDKDKGSGDKDYVSKVDFDKVNAKVEALAKKNEELISILTSPNFMAQRQTPEPKPEPKPVVEDKLPTAQELQDDPTKLVGYVVSKVGKMLDDHTKRQDERDKNISASIQRLVDVDEDRETQRQIKACITEFGQEEFDEQRDKMVELAGQYPEITARDCFLIAVGRKNPPVRKPVPTATETEKTGQAALFKDANLTPDEAADKAFEIHAGGKGELDLE